MKVDVAVQSYKKPELLLYSLMTLRKHSEQWIDTVFINDDSGDEGGDYERLFTSEKVRSCFPNWRIRFRRNRRRTGWWQAFVLGHIPRYVDCRFFLYRSAVCMMKTGHIFTIPQDIRYQWAIDETDKPYIYLIHDDTLFEGDTLGLYLGSIQGSRTAVVGDLGQCWRCPYQEGSVSCTPQRIMSGWRPSGIWPLTGSVNDGSKRACRINEWSCLLSVDAAKSILDTENAYFGNYDDYGDVGAYWFEQAIKMNFDFRDPLPTPADREKYYRHGWQGRSGHSVWMNQGTGKSVYDRGEILAAMEHDFGVVLLDGEHDGR